MFANKPSLLAALARKKFFGRSGEVVTRSPRSMAPCYSRTVTYHVWRCRSMTGTSSRDGERFLATTRRPL